jgi:aspartyl-tRNA(Asn)/glutamyl-tRNA(Gln) amidotransferase subunit C
MITRKDVEYVAALSRIDLDEAEKERFTHQLAKIVEYVDKLNELDVSGVEPMSHAVDLRNVMREDTPRPSLGRDDALANAPARQDGFFKVPRVIE